MENGRPVYYFWIEELIEFFQRMYGVLDPIYSQSSRLTLSGLEDNFIICGSETSEVCGNVSVIRLRETRRPPVFCV